MLLYYFHNPKNDRIICGWTQDRSRVFACHVLCYACHPLQLQLKNAYFRNVLFSFFSLSLVQMSKKDIIVFMIAGLKRPKWRPDVSNYAALAFSLFVFLQYGCKPPSLKACRNWWELVCRTSKWERNNLIHMLQCCKELSILQNNIIYSCLPKPLLYFKEFVLYQ